jgi:hypothetical protein
LISKNVDTFWNQAINNAVREFLVVLKTNDKVGYRIISVRAERGTKTPEGKLFFSIGQDIVAVFEKHEYINFSDRESLE